MKMADLKKDIDDFPDEYKSTHQEASIQYDEEMDQLNTDRAQLQMYGAENQCDCNGSCGADCKCKSEVDQSFEDPEKYFKNVKKNGLKYMD
jgi:hypothetical protein